MPNSGADAAGKLQQGVLAMQLVVDGEQVRLDAKLPPQGDGMLSLDTKIMVAQTRIPLQQPEALLAKSSGHIAGRWRFSSLRWLNALFSDVPWLTLEGAGEVVADVTVVDGRLAAGSSVDVPDIDMVATMVGNRVSGRGKAQGRLQADQRGVLRPHLDCAVAGVRRGAARGAQTSLRKRRQLELRLGRTRIWVRCAIRCRRGLRFTNARVPDLRAYNRYLPSQHLRFDGGSGTLSGDLSLDAAGDMASGQVRVLGRGAKLHVAGMAINGDVDIDMKLRRVDLKPRANLQEYMFVVAGSRIGLSNVGFPDADGSARQGWWGTANLAGTRLTWDRRMGVDGNFPGGDEGCGFLLDMFFAQTRLPRTGSIV